MRRGLVLLLALLGLPGLASAQGTPSFDRTESVTPPVLEPGQETSIPFAVRYCYATSGTVPATITVAVEGPAWMVASADPATFQGSVSGGNCGSRAVTLLLRAGRDAPAFEPENVVVHLTGRGAGGTETHDVAFAAQVDYATELAIEPPPRVRVPQGDQGRLDLKVGVGANAGTRLDIAANDPARKITAFIPVVSTSAGAGLDAVDPVTIPMTITVSPGAEPGVHRLPVTIATANARSPSNVGERETVNVEVEVTGGGGNPAPGPGALLVAGLAAAAALAVRGRRSKAR